MLTDLLRRISVWAMAIAVAVLLALAGWGGYQAGVSNGDRLVAEARDTARLAEMAKTHAALVRLKAAQARGDALTLDLSAARRAANRLRKERDDALSRVTTGRVCLDEPALRVLDAAPGLRVDLSHAAGRAAGANADRVATDTHIARWALDAGGQYDECRRRLDALIDFQQASPQDPQ